ncbi:MAG: hypothetical protein MN733_21335, partial [Nitrososphaera sp.]|nr:hypothetical protein [Nitrososphaera sp.]
MPDALPALRDEDLLGRGIFSERQAKRADRGKIVHNVFLEKEEVDSLSVDRLDHAPDRIMAEIGERIARRRGAGRGFYGWATLSVANASADGRSVRATPQLDNIYHADIDLNVPLGPERRDT